MTGKKTCVVVQLLCGHQDKRNSTKDDPFTKHIMNMCVYYYASVHVREI